MANTKASLTQQNTQTYPSNTSGSITALSVKSFNNNFINAVATLGDTNVFTEPQTFGNTVQVNSDITANNVYAGNIPYLSGSNTFTGPTNTFSGSVNIQTASIQFLTVDVIVSSSTINATGSNQLGDSAADTQTLWGTVDIKTGPLKVSGSVNVSGSIVATSFTGSLQGTSSWANNATTASHALTAVSSSFALNATSASYALSSSQAANATSASYALNSTSASYALSSSNASTASSADDFTVRGELFANELNTISSTVNASTRSVIINGGNNTITSASLSGIFNSTDSQILGKGITDNFESNNNTIIGGKTSVISGSNQSTILGGSVRMNNVTASVALARDTAYTASANYTLFTQNIQSSGSVVVTGSLLVTDGITGSLQGTASYAVQALSASWAPGGGGGGSTDTGSLLTTASVSLNTITFTKGDGSTFPITVDTGSGGGGGGGMNLGANTFTGSQTIQSSSIFLQASGSTALNTNFFTASTAGANFGANVLMFAGSNFSGSFTLSGSRNVGTINPGTSATNKNGGNLNGNFGVFSVSSTTASATPVLSNNFLVSGIQANIPNTSSVTTLTGNFVGGAIITTGSALSNVSITSNNIDGAIITNDFTGSSTSQQVTVVSNIIKGGSSQANFAQIKFASTSSNTNSRTFTNNIMFGPANIASLEASGAVSATSNLLNTAIIGSNLVVSGTMANTSTSASMFVGQFNETGSLADPSQIKFAVGTGTTNAARRTSFFVSQSGETVAVNLVPTTLNTQLTTTIQSTGSITNRIHPKQSGAMVPGAISSSAFISPEIGLEATSANFKVILERNLTGSVGPSGSYAFSLDFMNTVLVSGGTDSYVGLGKINGFCLPGRRPTTPFSTASIQNYINNDIGTLPTLSSSFDGTLYQVWARHQGGASSSFAYTGTEFYHSGSTQ